AATALSPRLARGAAHPAAAGTRHHDVGADSRRSREGLMNRSKPCRGECNMPFIAAGDGTQLYWRDWGQGAPLLFLNSFGMSSQMWDYQITAFAEAGFRCIGFDRRGHGRSDQPARGYDHDTFADDVAALIDELGLSGLILIGHSMAGGEIVRYLTRHGSGRVERIVL